MLSRLSIERPVTVVMVLLALLVVGTIAYQRIPIQLIPSGFDSSYLGVYVPYGNANPSEIEDQIARPVEEIMRTVGQLKKVSSYSSRNGCWFHLEFSQDADMRVAYNQVRDRIERVRPDLPDEIERIFIRKWNTDDMPVFYIGIVVGEEYEDPYYLVETHIKRPIERVDGVGNVEIWGAERKIIQIEIDQDRVRSMNVDIYSLVNQLRGENFALSSGYVKEGVKKMYVRSIGKFRTIEEVERIPVKGTAVRLGDVADIRYEEPEREWAQRINQKPAIRLGIFKESLANTVDLSRSVRDVIENEINKNPAISGMNIHILFDQGDFILEAVHNLETTGLWGAFFAMFVLFFFLRRVRMTIIMTLAIPLSIMIAVVTLYFSGMSLNILTLTGLMVSVGLVVDNSVVIMENIYRLRIEGKSRMVAAFQGAQEVGLAIVMATLTTIVVFLPLVLMSGDNEFSFFMKQFGLPVVAGLLGSLFVALVIIPLAASRMSALKAVREPKLIGRANDVYGGMIDWVLSHRTDTFIICIFVCASIVIPYNKISSSGESHGHINEIDVNFEFPPNYTLDDAGKMMTAAENYIMENEKRFRVEGIDTFFQPTRGSMEIFIEKSANEEWWLYAGKNILKKLNLYSEPFLSHEDAMQEINENIPVFPGVKKRMRLRESSSGQTRLDIMIYGDDSGLLKELANEAERRLSFIPELVSVETELERGMDEIQVNLHRTQANNYGTNAQSVAGTISYAVRGINLPDFHTDDREIDMIFQMKKSDREYLYQLANLGITTSDGETIPLSSVASFTIDKGVDEIRRTEGKTYLRVFAYTTAEDLSAIGQSIDRVMNGMAFPPGYTWTKGERFESMEREKEAQKFALILSITFVFLLMGVLFESFILPLSVIICIPFAFVGVFWMLYGTGTPLDVMAAIGFIILIGIVVNNAIVLVDRINRLRKEGMPRNEAIREAGKNRFRPIFMTAFTTILGLAPMAVGNTSMVGIPYAPMGRAIIGGLFLATFLTLFVVPLAYTFFDDLSNSAKRLIGNQSS